MKSVKTKIIVLVFCGIMLSSIAIGTASIINSRRVIAADSARIMNLLCENKASEVNVLFSMVEQSVGTLAVYASHQLTDLQRFQSDPSYVAEYTESLREVAVNAAQNTEGALTVYIRYNPEFTEPQSGLFCGRQADNGMFQDYAPTDLSLYSTTDTEHTGWFYIPKNTGTGTWIPPYLNQNIGVEMVSYVIPLYVGRTFVGVVGMDIDFSALKTIVGTTQVYETGYAYLTDNTGNIIYHPQLPRGTDLTLYNAGEFKGMVQTLQRASTSHGELISYSYNGEKRRAAFHSLANEMRFVLTAPASQIDATAAQLVVQIGFTVVVIVLVAAVWTFFFAKRLVRPLLELTDAAKKIAQGDLSVSITHQSKDEVGVLAESFRQTVAHLHKYISYINELAYRDSLTGVKNKTAYLEVTQRMDELARLKHPEYGVIVFDINGLKQVNDTMGHDYGDVLIISACKIICRVFKHSPVYRIGGDEFVVLLESADFERYHELLALFQEAVLHHNADPCAELPVSIACGVAVYSAETDHAYHDVFQRADSTMYRNKAEMKQVLPPQHAL